MIEISKLSLDYSTGGKKTSVLKNIDLSIHEGETVGLMGANGSGKTSLARCLNSLLLPGSGQVTVDGMDTRDDSQVVEIRRRVGMVFQNPENQIVSTTVEREIAFGLENLGVPQPEMRRIVDETLESYNLAQHRQRPPHLLSGGELQRLALAAVIATSPKYLVLDEPTSLLDAAGRELILSYVRSLNSRSDSQPRNRPASVLLITQYPEETLLLNRLLILCRGEVVFDAPPQEVFENVTELHEMGVDVPVEFEVNHYLKEASAGQLTLNPSDFLPIP